MTNEYNNGDWWGWNGGECPVHPQSEVEVVFTNTYGDVKKDTRSAGIHSWRNPGTHAFRVVKAYREPKEIWVNEYQNGQIRAHKSEDDADNSAGLARVRCVKYREVLE